MTNLPILVSSFVGRKKELGELELHLARTRLLTLTGAGGCGKTRLAIELAAEQLQEFPDGVWLVDLANLSESDLLARAVAQALGIRLPPNREPTDALTDFLATRNTLLVLDNCEHLIDAVAGLATVLVLRCPALRMIATSREGLNIDGEFVWIVPSMQLPGEDAEATVAAVEQYDAVRLFVARAVTAAPSFQLTEKNASAVAQICQRLAGLPLAIELAAARIKFLGVQELLSRLDDAFAVLHNSKRTAPPRHHTLRAAIDWSYALLSEPEQILFRRLAVFAGSFTIEAAERICSGKALEQAEVLNCLSRLADKSLVVVDEETAESRYRLLEPLRQYAQQKLSSARELETVRSQQVAFAIVMAETVDAKLHGPDQVAGLDLLERERENLRAALAWSRKMQDAENGLRLAGALWWFWVRRGSVSEGMQWLREFFEMRGGSDRVRAAVLARGAFLAWRHADYARLEEWSAQSLKLAHDARDQETHAFAVMMQGGAARDRGEGRKAQARLQQAFVLFDRIHHKWGMGWVCLYLAPIFYGRERYEQGKETWQTGLRLFRELDDLWGIAMTLTYLAQEARRVERNTEARAWLEESLEVFRKLGDTYDIARCLTELSQVAQAQGDDERATVWLGEAFTLLKQLGLARPTINAPLQLASIARQRGDLRLVLFLLQESLPQVAVRNDPRWLAIYFAEFGALACAVKNFDAAARLFGAAQKQIDIASSGSELFSLDEYSQNVNAARAALGEQAFSAAYQEGRSFDSQAAIALAERLTLSPEARELTARAKLLPDRDALTPREVEVLKLLAEGLSNSQIAERLVISRRTVTTHLTVIYDKLGVKSRSAATRYALDHHLA